MGLNAKEIPICFLRMIQVSIEASFTFIGRHPLIYGVLFILFILYSFLSYIYHFLVYLSPFLVCTAIFVRIFWTSEEGHRLNYTKKDDKKEEPKKIEKQFHKSPSYGKRDILLDRRYSVRSATSRRRNFTDKKWDAQYISVEANDRDLSIVESNDSEKKDAKCSEKEESSSNCAEKVQDTKTKISPSHSEASISEQVKASDSDQQNDKSNACSGGPVFEKEKRSSDHAEKIQNLDAQISPSQSEPSICDQVKTSDSDQQNNKSDDCSSGPALEKEDKAERKEEEEVEEGEESQEEEESQEKTNKVVEWSKDDQKNVMDLGIAEIERNRRLESLIARRRARQQMKLQMEHGLIDLRTSPSRMAPLHIRTDPLGSPRNYGGIEGLEIPGSAPSSLRQLRNPFDLPYDATEEKPVLTGDSFHQEFTPKDMTFCRHESFRYGPSLPFDEESYPFFINGRKISDRFRRLPEKGNHDLIIEKLFSRSSNAGIGIGTGVKAPKPLLTKLETTNQEDMKSKTDTFGMKWKKVENAQETKFISDHTSESGFMENSNPELIETDHKISIGVSGKLEESRIYDKPQNKKFLNFPLATSTAICESSFDSLSPPAGKSQENMFFPERCLFHGPTCSIASDLQVEFSEVGSPTALTIDGESVVFDGDIDKESVVTPRSEDLGGVPFNLRVSEEDITEVTDNSSKSSPVPPLEIVEDEDGVDVSSLSSTSDLHGDTLTDGKIDYGYNIFSDMKKGETEIQATQPSDTSNFLIVRLEDYQSHETQSKKPEERQNLLDNSETEAQVVGHHVSSLSSTSDLHGDASTHAKINYDYNIFSDMKKDEVEIQTTQPSNYSNFFISRFADHLPHEIRSEKPEERQNLLENSETEAQVIDHHENSPSSTSNSHGDTPTHAEINYDYNIFSDIKKDKETQNLSKTEAQAMEHHVNDSPTTDRDNSNSNDDLRPPFVHQHQELIHAVSINTFSSNSPRSLLPENTHANQVSSSSFNQHISTDIPQLNVEDMTQATPSDELPPNNLPPIIQALSIDPITQTHTSVYCDFQEPSCSSMVADDSNATAKSGKSIFDDEYRKENDTLIISGNIEPADPPENSIGKEEIIGKEYDAGQEKFENGKSNEDKSTLVVRQDDSIQSLTSTQMKIIEEINEKSEAVDNDEVTSSPPKVTENIDISTTIVDGQMAVELTQVADVDPPKLDKQTRSLEEVSDIHSESTKDDGDEEIKRKLENDIPSSKPSKPNDSLEEESNVRSELMKNDADIQEKLKNDTPTKLDETNDSLEKVSKAQSESQKNGPEINIKEDIKGELKNDAQAKLNKQSDSSGEVSKVPNESEKSDPETSNKEDIKEVLKNDIPTELDKPNDSSNEVSKVPSGSEKNDPEISNKEEIQDHLNNDTSIKLDKLNDSSNDESKVSSGSKKYDPKISNKEEIKEQLNNDTPTRPNKPNDSSEETSKVQSEPKENDPEMSNKVETKEQSNNYTSTKPNKPNHGSGEVSKEQSESKKNNLEMSNEEEIKEQLNIDISINACEPNDSLEKVNDEQSESRKNDAEINNEEDVKRKLENDISSKPNDNSEKVRDVHEELKEVEDDMEKDKLASGNIPKVNQVTRSSHVEDTEASKNEAVQQESNKKEVMALSSLVGTSEDSVTLNMKEPEEAVHFEK